MQQLRCDADCNLLCTAGLAARPHSTPARPQSAATETHTPNAKAAPRTKPILSSPLPPDPPHLCLLRLKLRLQRLGLLPQKRNLALHRLLGRQRLLRIQLGEQRRLLPSARLRRRPLLLRGFRLLQLLPESLHHRSGFRNERELRGLLALELLLELFRPGALGLESSLQRRNLRLEAVDLLRECDLGSDGRRANLCCFIETGDGGGERRENDRERERRGPKVKGIVKTYQLQRTLSSFSCPFMEATAASRSMVTLESSWRSSSSLRRRETRGGRVRRGLQVGARRGWQDCECVLLASTPRRTPLLRAAVVVGLLRLHVLLEPSVLLLERGDFLLRRPNTHTGTGSVTRM